MTTPSTVCIPALRREARGGEEADRQVGARARRNAARRDRARRSACRPRGAPRCARARPRPDRARRAADVDDVLPEPLDRLVRVELRDRRRAPSPPSATARRVQRRARRRSPRSLAHRRQPVACRRAPGRPRPAARAGRAARRDARRRELAEREQPLAEPAAARIERVRRSARSSADALDVGSKYQGSTKRAPRSYARARSRGRAAPPRRRDDPDDLARLDVGADRDDQIRVALEQVPSTARGLFHPSGGGAYRAHGTAPLTRSSEAGKESNASRLPSTPAAQRSCSTPTRSRRTLSRIAHEIIERNPELDEVALVGIQTRGVPLAQRLRRLIDERAGDALDARRARHHLPPRRRARARRPGAAPAQPLVRDTQLDFPLEGRTVVLVDDVLYTGRTIRAAIEALFDYGRPARVQLAVLADRGHRELPIRPDYVGKNLPTARGERIQVQLLEVDEVDRVLLVPSARRRPMTDLRLVGGDLRAAATRRAPPPALDRRPHPRRRRAAARHRALVRALAGARDEEAADAARPPRRQPLLRVVDADVVVVRARREAALCRHDDAEVRRLLGRQGRIAEGHGADALRVRPRRDRRPPSRGRRGRARRALDRRARRERRRREAPAPDPGAARPLHAARGFRAARWAARRDRRRRRCTRASRGRSCRRSRSSARKRCSLGRRRCCRRGLAPSRARHRRDRATPTSSTCSACSSERMLEGANFVPSLREYTARWGITPSACAPGSTSCTRARSTAASSSTGASPTRRRRSSSSRCGSGLVVRMAILYDLLTAGPVAVEAAVEAA